MESELKSVDFLQDIPVKELICSALEARKKLMRLTQAIW